MMRHTLLCKVPDAESGMKYVFIKRGSCQSLFLLLHPLHIYLCNWSSLWNCMLHTNRIHALFVFVFLAMTTTLMHSRHTLHFYLINWGFSGQTNVLVIPWRRVVFFHLYAWFTKFLAPGISLSLLYPLIFQCQIQILSTMICSLSDFQSP